MAEIVSNLFGVNLEQLELARNQAEQTPINYNMDPRAVVAQQYGNMGASLGRGAQKLFGGADPMMDQQRRTNDLLQQYQQTLTPEQMSDPLQMYGGLVKFALDNNMPEVANQAYAETQRAQDTFMKRSVDASKISENIASATKNQREALPKIVNLSRAFDDATSRGNTAEATAIQNQMIKEYELNKESIDQRIVSLSNKVADGSVTQAEKAQLDYLDNFKTKVARAGASVINTGAKAAEGEFGKEAAKFGVERQSTMYSQADEAVGNLTKIDSTIATIVASEARTGLFAEYTKNIDRAVAALGGKDAAKKASDTELLNALLGSEVFPQIGKLGIGARGLDTPAERDFLREVMAGTITMNKDTLLKMAKMRRRIEERALSKYNDAVDSGEMDAFFGSTK